MRPSAEGPAQVEIPLRYTLRLLLAQILEIPPDAVAAVFQIEEVLIDHGITRQFDQLQNGTDQVIAAAVADFK